MIDLNNTDTVNHLKKTAESHGKLLIEYFKQEIDKQFNFDDLDITEDNTVLGQKARTIIEIQDFMKDKIDFLTS